MALTESESESDCRKDTDEGGRIEKDPAAEVSIALLQTGSAEKLFLARPINASLRNFQVSIFIQQLVPIKQFDWTRAIP